jgi:hypothetical protein
LAEDGGRGLGKSTDEMDEAESVETESGDVGVLDKVLALKFVFVVFIPVSADGENLSCTAL